MAKAKDLEDKVANEDISFEDAPKSARELAYENYDKTLESSDEETSTQDEKPEVETEPEPDKTGEEMDVSDKEEEPAEEVPKAKPQEKIKTIPFKSYIEQRDHLRERARLAEEKARLAELRLSEVSQPREDSEYEPDSKVVELEKRLKAFEERAEMDRQAELERTRLMEIDKMDKELSQSGISGFRLNFPTVAEKLREVNKTDPDFAHAHDNPQGWAKFYAENVYPDLLKTFTTDKERQAEARRKEKEEMANKATLVGSPGSIGEKPQEPQTPREKYDQAVNEIKAGRVLF